MVTDLSRELPGPIERSPFSPTLAPRILHRQWSRQEDVGPARYGQIILEKGRPLMPKTLGSMDIRPGHVWSFEDLNPGTIALDGAVSGPRIDPDTHRYSFDHHAGCLRLITSATCQQVFDALVMGLDPTGMTCLLNDLDGDTVLSVWLLENHMRLRDPAERERVRDLVITVALGDAHGPAYPVPRPELAAHFHRVLLAPLRAPPGTDASAASPSARSRDRLAEVLTHLDRWWDDGRPTPPLPPLSGVPPRVTQRKGFVLAELPEDSPRPSPFGAAWLYAQGHDRLVLASALGGGRHLYTLARRSDLVRGFPVPDLCQRLNLEEERELGRKLRPDETWGGGSSVGGGPRGGSALAPDRVVEVIEAYLQQELAHPTPP